jgi:hypothetical protein
LGFICVVRVDGDLRSNLTQQHPSRFNATYCGKQ